MRFKRAVEETPSTRGAYRNGLQALGESDRDRITAEVPRHLLGSLNLDAALRDAHPNASRWDYGVGYRTNNTEWIFWIEVHPATGTDHLGDMVRKVDWLRQWLATDGHRLDELDREFIWISSGRTEFTASSPQRRRLSAKGLRLVGRHFRIK